MSVEAVSNQGLSFEQIEAVNDYVENLIFYQKDGIDFEITITNLLQGPQTPEVKECLARVFTLACPISNIVSMARETLKKALQEDQAGRIVSNYIFFALWYRLNQQLGVSLPIDMQFDYKTAQEIKEDNAPWMNILIDEYKRLIESNQIGDILNKAVEVYSKDQQKRLAMQFASSMMYLHDVKSLEDVRVFVSQLSVLTSFLQKMESESQKELLKNPLFMGAVKSVESAITDVLSDDVSLHELQPLLEDVYQILSTFLEFGSNDVELDLFSIQKRVLKNCLLRADKENLQKYLETLPNKKFIKFAELNGFGTRNRELRYLYENDEKQAHEMLDIVLNHFEIKKDDILEGIGDHEKERILESYMNLVCLKAEWAFKSYKDSQDEAYLHQAVEFRKQALNKKEEYDLQSYYLPYELEHEIEEAAKALGLSEAV